jgi:hypothetical protein
MLYHLIYISTSVQPFEEEDFIDLLIQSRVANLINNITGVLLYNQGHFIQYIEGEQSDILSLIEKIKIDQRHYDLQIIEEGPIAKRSFTNWSMNYHLFPPGELEEMVGCNCMVESKGSVSRAIKIVKLFAKS